MTTELVLLIGLFAFVVIGGFLGDKGPKAVFVRSAPRLGARVEAHLSTGQGFKFKGKSVEWKVPSGPLPPGTPYTD